MIITGKLDLNGATETIKEVLIEPVLQEGYAFSVLDVGYILNLGAGTNDRPFYSVISARSSGSAGGALWNRSRDDDVVLMADFRAFEESNGQVSQYKPSGNYSPIRLDEKGRSILPDKFYLSIAQHSVLDGSSVLTVSYAILGEPIKIDSKMNTYLLTLLG